MSISVLDRSLWDAHVALKNRELPVSELVESALERAQETQRLTRAFLSIDPASARAQAQALADQPVSTPLHSIPLAHKDCLAHAGQKMSVGSRLERSADTQTASVIRRLQAQQAIEIGKLHLSEVIAGPSGNNVILGDCLNAWNPAYISGGSSSGSAVAVATGSVFAALGTDTGGSIRIPAAANGLFGLKPSFGRVSRYGAFPRSASVDVIGPLARTAQDCAIMLDAIAGADPLDSDTLAVPRPNYLRSLSHAHSQSRLAVLSTGSVIEDQVMSRFDELLHLASRLWGPLLKRRFAQWEGLYALGDVLSKVEAAQVHAHNMARHPQHYSTSVYARTEPGLHLPATRYLETLQLRPLMLQQFLAQAFEQVDVLLLPTLPMTTPLIADINMQAEGQVHQLVPRLTGLTRPFSYLGLPVLSMPMGLDAQGMPLGVQLIGKPYAEARLLSIAHRLSLALDWGFLPSDLIRQLKQAPAP